MTTPQEPPTRRPSPIRRLVLARGESIVFSAGLAVVAVVLGILAASSWWTLQTYRTSLQRGRAETIKAAGSFVAEAASAALSRGDLSAARKIVLNAAADFELSRCRITLMDSTVIADAETTQVGEAVKRAMPEQLPKGTPRAEFEETPGLIRSHVPVLIAGQGPAQLVVESTIEYPLLADWETQAGIGAIGIAGMAGLLGAYRLMRRRVMAMGSISEALRIAASGESSAAVLHVSESFGAEACAWNRLVRERETLQAGAAVRTATEKVLSRSGGEGDLSSAFDAMWSGILIVDDSGKVRYSNGAAGVLLQRRREELTGFELLPIVNDPAAAPIIGVASGKIRQRTSVELERRSTSGERTLLRLTARPMRREDSAAAVVLVEDVTQQRVADEARNAFVAQATHELRTPLTNIRLYVETMVDEGENDPSVRSKCINVIGNEARRLERIVSDMLSVSEIEAGSLKLRSGDIRLDALFEELQADFKAQAEDKEIKLTFGLPPKLPVMNGDRDKLMLALHNLVGNALKYTPTGGEVTVRIEAGDTLTVAVTDNGIGIAPDEQELIFEKFYRAKDRRIAGITGSGIGLALARQVVRMHGGDITVTSQIDKGSTFTLSVPVAQGSAVKAAA